MNRRLGVLVACGLLLSSCAAESPRNSAGQVTAPATVDSYSIKVGDCVSKLESDSASRLPLVPCDQEHAWEAFATGTLTGDEFPGNNGVQSQGGELCTQAFEPFIGVPAKKSKFELRVLAPTKESWAQQDREVVCLVGSSAGKLTGSLAGAAK